MKILEKLERRLQRFAIPNLTLYLIAGQTILFVLSLSGKLDTYKAVLVPALVINGEWWRLITFLFIPPLSNPLFIMFAWYLFYLMGTALEEHWGTFKYNVFLIMGYVLTVAAAFAIPSYPASNVFLAGSVFLAFAHLFPDFIITLFFVLPVRIKWLALLTWLGYGYQFIMGSWDTRLMVLASVGNFMLFFGGDIIWMLKNRGRRVTRQIREKAGEREPYHKCTICGITDHSHPAMDFRYCPDCAGQFGYCKDHIFSHEHVK